MVTRTHTASRAARLALRESSILPRRAPRLALALLLASCAAGCRAKPPEPAAYGTAAPAAEAPAVPLVSANASRPTTAPVPTYGYEIVEAFPHDPQAFTQGLVFLQGIFLEGTGLNGRSSLRKVDPATGRVREQIDLASEYFGEGVAVLGGKVYQLTWQNHVGFIYDLATFAKTGEFAYPGEGWGLTTDGTSLILSDGTADLRFIDPATFKVTRTIRVFDHSGQPLANLNELEFIRGEIYANVWRTSYVVRIDPADGRLAGVIDFAGLLPAPDRTPTTDVLNGIAYDAANDRLFVTGKNWPKLFEVRLVPRQP